jgi:hypothetical protein
MTIQTSLNSKTSLSLGANAGQLLLPGRGHVNLQSGVMGTVRHQLTPGLVFQVCFNSIHDILARPYWLIGIHTFAHEPDEIGDYSQDQL